MSMSPRSVSVSPRVVWPCRVRGGHRPRGRSSMTLIMARRDQQLAQDDASRRCRSWPAAGRPRSAVLGQAASSTAPRITPGKMAEATQHHHGDDITDFIRLNDSGEMKPGRRRTWRPRHRRRWRPCEGEQLQVARVDAHGLGGDLVLADRHPGAPMRENSSRWQMTTLNHTSSRKQVVVERDRRQVEAEDVEFLAPGRAEELSESIWPMPLGPW